MDKKSVRYDPYSDPDRVRYEYISCPCGRMHAESQRGQTCNQWPFWTIGRSLTEATIING